MIILNQGIFNKRSGSAYQYHKLRARQDGQVLGYTLEQLRAHIAHTSLCPYCRCLLTSGTYFLDHAHPTSRGGPHTLANLAVCCRACNEQKGNLTAEEFQALLTLVRQWAPIAQSQLLTRLRAGSQRLGQILAQKRRTS